MEEQQPRLKYKAKILPYGTLLASIKFLFCLGLFVCYDLAKIVHVVQLLFAIKSGSTAVLLVLQKPFSSGKRLSNRQWFSILRHAVSATIVNLLWLFGLTLCGPVRTLLLFEHSNLVVLGAVNALFMHGTSPAKFRGAVFFLVAIVTIFLFDHDDETHSNESTEAHKHGLLSHVFDHVTSLTGLSDHKGGVVVLMLALVLQVVNRNATRGLALEVGGAKRLHAVESLVSSIVLAPWALIVFFTRESVVASWFYLLIPLILVAMVFVANFYIESLAVQQFDAGRASWLATLAVSVSAVAIACFWHHPFVGRLTTTGHLRDVISVEEHVLSAGVVFSAFFFVLATRILALLPQQTVKGGGNLIGYSEAGLPLYSFSTSSGIIQKTSQSAALVIKNGLHQILDDSDSRKIFYFLCVNLMFTFVELVYGMWTNSLGLISDGFHMLFDCSALVLGLYAAVMSHWPPTKVFSYGFDRFEVLSGFINGLFLLVIAFFVFIAAISRIIDPPDIHTERLLVVSVAGFCVNMFGIAVFRHNHSHGGGGHGHSHGGSSHSHSRDDHAHSHAHDDHAHSHSHGSGHHDDHHHGHSHSEHKSKKRHESLADDGHLNSNMQGVFLHVLADTLGSVGVIISTLLIENFGWKIADPICSLFIACLIFMSVVPLVRETSLILLLHTPRHLYRKLAVMLQKILAIDGVVGYCDEHIWQHSSKVVCCTLRLQIKRDSSEQRITAQVTGMLKEVGATSVTLQVEKQQFYEHLAGLGLALRTLDNTMSMAQRRDTSGYRAV